jgi:tetratricopeptide (TPR) repeat protein
MLIVHTLRLSIAAMSAGVLLLTLGAHAARAAPPAVRHPIDVSELEVIEVQHPKAARLFEEGESLLHSGQLQRAREIFEQVHAQAPHSALAARRYCQVLTALGERQEAVRACNEMLRSGGSPLEQRAFVGALMANPEAPKAEEVAQAKMIADSAIRRVPSEPWGYAANCDIAARIGDERMFTVCVEDLEQVAPDHYETKRAEAALITELGNWKLRLGLGWLGVGLLCLLALVQGVRRALGGRAVRSSTAAAAVFCLFASLGAPARAEPSASASSSAAASAQPSEKGEPEVPSGPKQRLSQYRIDDNDPEKSVPTNEQRDHNPLHFGYFLMDLADAANEAFKAKDYAKAIKYYRAMAKAVPDRAVAFSKICECYELMGDRAQALKWCGVTVILPGVTLGDYERYARLALSKKGDLSPDDLKDLENVTKHLKKDESSAAKTLAQTIQCELGARNSDVPRLEGCVAELVKQKPNDAKTVYFQWALAVSKNDASAASDLLKKAEQVKMESARLSRMQRVTEATRKRRVTALLRDWRFLGGGAVLMLLGASIMIGTRMRRTRRVPVRA